MLRSFDCRKELDRRATWIGRLELFDRLGFLGARASSPFELSGLFGPRIRSRGLDLDAVDA